MKNKYFLIILFSCSVGLLNAQQVTLVLAASVNQPVDIKHAGDKRLFIVSRTGTISILDSNGMVRDQPFLTITDRVFSNGSEQGLLGLAFDPDYKTNGFFYVDYTRKNDGWTRISRFHLTGDPNHCDSTTEQILLTIYQPFSNHNGGDLNFGPDGYLYISMGDGGDRDDPGDRAQHTDSLLGKILRIDVSDSSVSYKIPPDNPFVGTAGRDEVWDYGLRNPWRFSFDRQTGELWIADVGQDQYEEINLEAANSGSINYGWRCYEGNTAYITTGCNASNYTFPIYVYDHNNGCSVTGGYRYRGTQFPAFAGKYFFADYCVGTIRYLTETSPGVFTNTTTSADLTNVSTFGEDVNGELYVGSIGGNAVYRICDTSCLTAVSELNAVDEMSIYPNPNQGLFYLDFTTLSTKHLEINVTNVFGQNIFRAEHFVGAGDHHLSVVLNSSTAGIYFLRVTADQQTVNKKFVVR